MSVRLEAEYENELAAIRHLAKDFAREHPAVASRLILSEETRLVARSARRAADRGLRVPDGPIAGQAEGRVSGAGRCALGMLYPHYLAPIPSMAIAQMHLDAAPKRA